VESPVGGSVSPVEPVVASAVVSSTPVELAVVVVASGPVVVVASGPVLEPWSVVVSGPSVAVVAGPSSPHAVSSSSAVGVRVMKGEGRVRIVARLRVLAGRRLGARGPRARAKARRRDAPRGPSARTRAGAPTSAGSRGAFGRSSGLQAIEGAYWSQLPG